MRKHIKLLFLTLIALAIIIPLSGCGGDEGTFDGELKEACQNKIVVMNGSDMKEFVTSDETTYKFADEDHLNIGDTLQVSYHSKGSNLLADSIVVQKTKKHVLVLDGTVSDLNKDNLTITSDSLTATFTYDDDTEIDGDLNEGDEVKVTYKGNLSQSPYALKIQIVKEEKDDTSYESHGIIADVSDTTILLSVDSATAYRFQINDGTEVDSSDNKIEVGDRAEVTFTGDINEDPVATKVVVHHQAKKNQNVINGKIKNAQKTKFTLDTGKNKYLFLINGNTKFTGYKYQNDAQATVSYTGELGKDPLAVSIYCDKVKKKKDPTTKTTQPTTEQPTTEPTTETDTTEPPAPTPTIVEATGVLTVWDGDAMTCEIKINDPSNDDEVVDLDMVNADIPCGYFPQVGDTVLIKYNKDTMELMHMQLIDRPDPDPQPEPTEPTETPTEPSTTEETTTTEATTTEAPTTTTQAPETTAAPQDDDDSDDGE